MVRGELMIDEIRKMDTCDLHSGAAWRVSYLAFFGWISGYLLGQFGSWITIQKDFTMGRWGAGVSMRGKMGFNVEL